MNNNLSFVHDSRRVTLFIILSLAAIATLIRVPGLGKWCFASDEFYLSQSIKFLLDSGVPRFPSGGYYVRGIGIQYLMAIPVSIFKNREFALRLIPFIFGVLTVPLFYLLCREFLPVPASVVSTMMLLFSSWHIEFSRFARFYTPFQFVFIAFIYFFYSGYWKNVRRHQVYSWILSFLAILIFEGSIFMPVVLMLPLFKDDKGENKKKNEIILIIAILLILNFVAHGIGYRNFGVKDRLPLNFQVDKSSSLSYRSLGSIVLPDLRLLKAIGRSWKFLSIFSLLFCFSGFLTYKTVRKRKDLWDYLFTGSLVIFSMIYQFGLVVLLSIFFHVHRRRNRYIFFDNLYLWISYFLSVSLFWIFVLYSTNNLNLAKHFLIGYPPLRYSIIQPFAKAVPLWGIYMLVILGISTLHELTVKVDKPANIILSASLACIIALPFFDTPYMLTRYCFFFFPLVLLLSSIEVDRLIETIMRKNLGSSIGKYSIVLILLPIIIFSLTEDFQLKQITDVSAKEINFRMGKYERYMDHWHPRMDFETPAEYVNKAYMDGDVTVTNSITVAQYLDDPFVFFSKPTAPWFTGYSRKRGSEEIWTGSPMYYDVKSVMDLVPENRENSMWMIVIGYIGPVDLLDLPDEYDVDVSLEYVAIDGRFKVFRLNRRPSKISDH